jgi:plasmid stabilization system protein ParE
MAYKLERARDTDADLEAIFDFLVQSYTEFGDTRGEAIERAAKRLDDISDLMLTLGAAPHQGTKRDDILPGLRSVTKDRAIYYFDVEEEARRVRVLAIFFGGQDHRRAMLKRLMG